MNLVDNLFAKKSSASAANDKDPQQKYYEAIRSHPFVHRGNYHTCVRNHQQQQHGSTNNNNNNNKVDRDDASPSSSHTPAPVATHVKDSLGNTVCILLRNAFPEKATHLASSLLMEAAGRSSLRASIFGGESPFSGIAGYYDYFGSPIEYKCRKTSFTSESVQLWPRVFPLVDYAAKLYEKICPEAFEEQNRAIPDAVRIHGSPFSTLTINQRFRTAMHTDAGDFDNGFGLISVLDGEFDGCHLGFPYFGVCVELRVGDLIFFETHHCHANTELELLPTKTGILPWSRLSCVFYYRAVLGEETCKKEYKRRLLKETLKRSKNPNNSNKPNLLIAGVDDDELETEEDSQVFENLVSNGIAQNVNGTNLNKPATVPPLGFPTPFTMALLHREDSHDPSSSTMNKLKRLQQIFDQSKQNIIYCADHYAANEPSLGWNRPHVNDGDTDDDDFNFARNATNLHLHLFDELPRAPILFNEDTTSLKDFRPDSVNFGVLQRSSISFRPVDVYRESTGLAQHDGPSLGGFSESAVVKTQIQNDSNIQIFKPESLRLFLSKELLEMWTAAKTLWLEKVARDWKKIKDRRDSDEDEANIMFSWNNTGDMNKAFFDLCDVASEVMLAMLQAEEATSEQKSRFWAAFAFFLFRQCQTVNEMPETAMSMKKLNVKLKDYTFGGTRYFKDQSADEQARRTERKRKIAEARRKSAKFTVGAKTKISGKRRKRNASDDNEDGDSDDDSFVTSSDDDSSDDDSEDEQQRMVLHKKQKEENWLLNDDFDYQTENVKILYNKTNKKGKGKGSSSSSSSLLPTPDENALRFRFLFGEGKKVHDSQRNPITITMDKPPKTIMDFFKVAALKKQEEAAVASAAVVSAHNSRQQLEEQAIKKETSIKILLVVGNTNKNNNAMNDEDSFFLDQFSQLLQTRFDEVSSEIRQSLDRVPTNIINHQQQQQEQQQHQITFSVWSKQIRGVIATMMETIRILFTPALVRYFELINPNCKLERFLFSRFLPFVHETIDQVKDDAVFLYEHLDVLVTDAMEINRLGQDAAAVGYSRRGMKKAKQPSAKKKPAATTKNKPAPKRKKRKGSSSDDDDDDSSSSSSDDDSDSDSDSDDSSSSSSDSSSSVQMKNKSKKKQTAVSKKPSAKQTKKANKVASKAEDDDDQNNNNNDGGGFVDQKKKEDEWKNTNKEYLIKRVRDVFSKFKELFDVFQIKIRARKQQQQQQTQQIVSTSFVTNFQLASDFNVQVTTKTVSEIMSAKKQQQQQFDLIIVDVMFESLMSTEAERNDDEKRKQQRDEAEKKAELEEQQEKEKKRIEADDEKNQQSQNNNNNNNNNDDDMMLLMNVDAAAPVKESKTSTTKKSSSSSSSYVFPPLQPRSAEKEFLLLSKLKSLFVSSNDDSSSLIYWIAPNLTQDSFHFMLNDRVREGFIQGGLPRFAPLLYPILHPRAAVENNSNNHQTSLLFLPTYERLVAKTNLDFLTSNNNNDEKNYRTVSEFDIPMSFCQRRVHCVKI